MGSRQGDFCPQLGMGYSSRLEFSPMSSSNVLSLCFAFVFVLIIVVGQAP
jgi:hypothetical protein